jgi:hypothetical protein
VGSSWVVARQALPWRRRKSSSEWGFGAPPSPFSKRETATTSPFGSSAAAAGGGATGAGAGAAGGAAGLPVAGRCPPAGSSPRPQASTAASPSEKPAAHAVARFIETPIRWTCVCSSPRPLW